MELWLSQLRADLMLQASKLVVTIVANSVPKRIIHKKPIGTQEGKTMVLTEQGEFCPKTEWQIVLKSSRCRKFQDSSGNGACGW